MFSTEVTRSVFLCLPVILLVWFPTVGSAHHLNCTNETRVVYYNDTVTYLNWTQSIVFNTTTNETIVVNQTVPVSVSVLCERNVTYTNCTVDPDGEDTFDLFDPNNWRLLIAILLVMAFFVCLLFVCMKISKSYSNNRTSKIGIRGRNQAKGFVDQSGSSHMPLGTVDTDACASSADLVDVSISTNDVDSASVHTHKHHSISSAASAPSAQSLRPAAYGKLSNPTAQLNLLDHPDGERTTTAVAPSDASR